MKKNIFVLVLALSAFCSVFAFGCANNSSADGNSDTQPSSSANATNLTAKDVIAFGEKYYLRTDNNTKYYIFNENNTCTYYYTIGSSTLKFGSINLKWVETSDRAIHLFENYKAGEGNSAKDTTR